MLDRVIDEMNEDLVRMRQATAKVMASERQMTAKYSQAQVGAQGDTPGS
jgi:phage shock protein A